MAKKRAKTYLIRRPLDTHFIIITGLSGSGKASALKAFEDLGYYCIDNLPIDLIPEFADLCQNSVEEYPRIALVVDVREGAALHRFPRILQQIKARDLGVRLLFLEASTAALLRRFSETRRPHPLLVRQAMTQSIALERKKMKPIRRLAEMVIDTSSFTVHELRRTIMERFIGRKPATPLQVNVLSFGFHDGVPSTSDLVFDVRFLPNPNFIPSYRLRTGNDSRVSKYVFSFKQTREFLDRLTGFLKFLLPLYVAEGKSYLNIAIGCTGGRHRSVVIANYLHKLLRSLRYKTTLHHRDIAHEHV